MLNPTEELTDSFHKGADRIYELAQLLQISLDKIQSIITKITDPEAKVKLYEDECEIIQAQLGSYDESFTAAKNFVTTYAKKLDTVLSVLSPSIRWLPEKSMMMDMVYQDGTSPWLFTLLHNNNTIDEINSLLEEHFSKGILQPILVVASGDFVCCYEKKSLYRALVLGIMQNDRVKVINIDNNHVKIVKKENIFDLTVDLLDIPAQAIQCCLLAQDCDDEKVWCDELNAIFKATLSECKLTVNINEKIDTLPPKFVIELYGFNESMEAESNLSDWVCNRILPQMRHLTKNSNEDVTGLLREDALDPYYLQSSTDSQLRLRSRVEEVPPNFEELTKGKSSTLGKPEKMSTTELGSKNKQNNTNNKGMDKEKEVKHKLSSLFKERDGLQKGEPNQIQTKSFTKTDFGQKNELQTAKITNDMTVMHAAVPEPIELGNIITCLSEQYQPQDEKNICQFYKKNNYCWKPTCAKQHKSSTTLWTDDVIETFSNVFNSLNLPLVGEETNIKVLTVVSGHSFYSSLHPNYSDIGEGVIESLDSLTEDLNNIDHIKTFAPLIGDPTIGELVLALSSNKNFQRATIADIFEDTVYVYYPDHGFSETISYSDLRQIKPQFMHLPYQAVLTNLANIYTLEAANQAKLYLESLIRGQILRAKVIKRNVSDIEIDVELLTTEGININTLLVDKGYCSEYIKSYK